MKRGIALFAGSLLLVPACAPSGGNNAAAPNATGANAAAGGAAATGTGTEWGVWASAAGGQWSDPCAIQYAAAQVAGNRYDGDPGYRRVRTRATQPEADLDIDHFGRYHRDQPDGVVKLTSCDAAVVGMGGTSAASGASQGAGAGGAAAHADISGSWRGYNNYAYTIRQDGTDFTWTVGELQETARGSVNGDSVSASWENPQWSGSGTGTVERDASGRAIRIRWSNGIIFER